MAVRQYIGARYVPKFYEGTNGNNWDANIPYEALTIVTYLNLSYTSKKAVPANIGNPASNPDYWVLTGNYSGAYGELRTELTEVEGTVTDLGERVTDVEEEVTEVKKPTRKFILIGDSYGMRNPLNWIYWMKARFDVVASNAVSGRGFVTGNVNNFNSMLDETYATLTEAEIESVTDVVVCGGWNDAKVLTSGGASTTQLQAAIKTFVENASEKFPNAQVWCGFIGWELPSANTDVLPTAISLYRVQNLYNNSYFRNMYHIQCASYVMRNLFMIDESGFHPNTDGDIELFYAIAGALFRTDNYYKSAVLAKADYIPDSSTALFIGATAPATFTIRNNQATLKTAYTQFSNPNISGATPAIADGVWCEFKNVFAIPNTGEGQYVDVFLNGTATYASSSETLITKALGLLTLAENGNLQLKVFYAGFTYIKGFTGLIQITARIDNDQINVTF